LSYEYPVDVRVYIEKETLSVGDENEKITKSEGVRLQACDSVAEGQKAAIYNLASVWLSLSILTESLFRQFEEGLQSIDLIRR
jgi:hypothetical protein